MLGFLRFFYAFQVVSQSTPKASKAYLDPPLRVLLGAPQNMVYKYSIVFCCCFVAGCPVSFLMCACDFLACFCLSYCDCKFFCDVVMVHHSGSR